MAYNFDILPERRGTNSMKYDFVNNYFGTDDILPMWVADMDIKTPEFIINALRKRLDHEILGYTLKSDSFYNAIINWVRKRYNWDIKKEWILFSPGVVPSLAFCVMAFSEKEDKVVIQPPVYHPFFHVIEANKRKILTNQLVNNKGHYEIDFDDLENKIDNTTKILFLCNPHNPVGRVWKEDELKRIGDICTKNNIIIMSDEIHADVIYKPNKHIPIAAMSSEFMQNTITAFAPSKTFNIAGLAASILVIPNKKLYSKMNSVISKLHLGMGNLFGVEALEIAYDQGEDWLENMLKYLYDNILFVKQYLKSNIRNIDFCFPESTYLLWLNCEKLGLDKKQLKDFFIREARVGFNDGPSFGDGGEGFQRMNIGCPRPLIKEALIRIERAIKTMDK